MISIIKIFPCFRQRWQNLDHSAIKPKGNLTYDLISIGLGVATGIAEPGILFFHLMA